MKEDIKRLILKYKDVASGLRIEAVETEYSDDAEKCYVEINTLENVIHDLEELLKDCSIPVVIESVCPVCNIEHNGDFTRCNDCINKYGVG